MILRSGWWWLAGVGLGAAVLGGCDGIDTDRFTPVACAGDYWTDVLTGLSLSQDVSYLELRELGKLSGEEWVVQSLGDPCANAKDGATCEAALAAASSTDGFPLGQDELICHRYYLVTTSADDVLIVNTTEQLAALLGSVDTPTEAVLRTMMAGYQVTCDDRERGGVLTTTEGFEVLATRLTSYCLPFETTRYRLRVSTAGTIEELESEVIERHQDWCM